MVEEWPSEFYGGLGRQIRRGDSSRCRSSCHICTSRVACGVGGRTGDRRNGVRLGRFGQQTLYEYVKHEQIKGTKRWDRGRMNHTVFMMKRFEHIQPVVFNEDVIGFKELGTSRESRTWEAG